MLWSKPARPSRPARETFRRPRLTFEELERRDAPAVQNLANPPTFTWNPVPGATYYDVWVGSDAVAIERNTTISGTSWTAFRPLTPGFLYTWWVRGVTSTGATLPWSAGTQFTVTSSLPVPTLVSPVATTVAAFSTTFIWNPVVGANAYDVWVDDVTGGQSQYMRNTELITTNWTPPNFVFPGHVYQWWVRASSAVNVFGPWSSAGTFRVTGTPTVLPPVPAIPAPTGLVAQNVGIQPTFTWNLVNNAAFFDLWVDDTTSGQTQVIRTQTALLQFTSIHTLLQGDTYTWWVRGFDANSNPGPWSAPAVFTVPALATPVLLAPSVQGGTSSIFSWSTVALAAVYDVWIDDLTTGQQQVIDNQSSTNTLTPLFLQQGHTYRWWVQAWTANGGHSPWSLPLTFTAV